MQKPFDPSRPLKGEQRICPLCAARMNSNVAFVAHLARDLDGKITGCLDVAAMKARGMRLTKWGFWGRGAAKPVRITLKRKAPGPQVAT